MPTLPAYVVIRQRREHAGLTQRDLAERLGVSERTVIRWESGAAPKNGPREELAKLLGGNPDDYAVIGATEDAFDALRGRVRRLERDLHELRVFVLNGNSTVETRLNEKLSTLEESLDEIRRG